MSEIRKDYATNTWVVIATERGKRPSDLQDKAPGNCVDRTASQKEENCPFCPGNEEKTPPEIGAFREPGSEENTPGWWVRTTANKFPALRIEGDVNYKVNHIFSRMNGIGAHEVVVEMPEHYECLATKTAADVEEVIQMYKDRYTDLTGDKRFRYILIFKNHGSRAGASLFHPHSQIIATPMIPRRIMDELESTKHYFHASGGYCLFTDIIKDELEAKERIIVDDEHFIALAPYASRFPFETWIIPKAEDPSFEDINEVEKKHLAKVLWTVLAKLYKLLGDPAYNYYIHTAPCDGKDYRFYHWHIEITPRLTHVAGFERGTGFYINPMPPEDAARYMRETEV